jgi:hypothetical protein
MSPGHGCGLRGRPHLHIQLRSLGPLDCFASLAMTSLRPYSVVSARFDLYWVLVWRSVITM